MHSVKNREATFHKAARLSDRAALKKANCDYRSALKLHQKSLQLLKSPPDSPHIAQLFLTNLLNIGEIQTKCGFYRQASAVLNKAFSFAQKNFGESSEEATTVLIQQGVLFKYTADFAHSSRCYHKALRILQSKYHRDHSSIATLYHNLGGLEHARHRYKKGELYARISVAMRKRLMGPLHRDVAADQAALASLLYGQRKYKEAENLYRQSLRIFRRIYGPEHYEVAVNLNNLGAVYFATGCKAKAESLFNRALELKKQIFGEQSFEVAITLNNLARLRKSESRFLEARQFYRAALSIFDSCLPATHPILKRCRAGYEQFNNQEKNPFLKIQKKLLVIQSFLDPKICRELCTHTRITSYSSGKIIIDGKNLLDLKIRKVKYMKLPHRLNWMLRQRLRNLMTQLESCFAIKLSHLEKLQLLRYNKGDFFKLHRDAVEHRVKRKEGGRKVSLVLFLNERSRRGKKGQYCGGELNLYDVKPGGKGVAILGQSGLLVAFSSKLPHEVTPILSGHRVTIAAWFY